MGADTAKPQQNKTVVIVQPANGTTPVVATAKVVEVKTTPTARSVMSQNLQNLSVVRSWVQNITESLLKVGPWIRSQKQQFQNSECSKGWNDIKTSFGNHIGTPVCNLYQTIPEKITQAKFELIGPYTFNQRFAALNIFCALTAIGTITSSAKINPFSRLLRATRNAGFMYILGGLLIAPQVYNPLMRKD